MPYANRLDPDVMPSNSTTHSDQSFFTLRRHFLQLRAILKHFENGSTDDNVLADFGFMNYGDIHVYTYMHISCV